MKFLLDQNLSPRLVESLQASYPGSSHVREFGLEREDDRSIWDFARRNGYAVLSKDSDFHQMSFLYGHPPKVVWIHLGNCSTEQIRRALQGGRESLSAFEADDGASFLALT